MRRDQLLLCGYIPGASVISMKGLGAHRTSRFCSQEPFVCCKVFPNQDFDLMLSRLVKETSNERCHGYCQHPEAGRR
jgi:hypothetical protein